MRILRGRQIALFIESLRKRRSIGGGIEETVRGILQDVRRNGDRAVRRYTERFDSVRLEGFLIEEREIESLAAMADKRAVKALKLSAKRIRDFHERQKEGSWSFTRDGITLGQIIRPLERVGVYVPGGKASYPSTVLMNVIPAQVAGVKEIALCVPTPRNEINPYVMFAIRMLGLTEVYRIGGAQAIGAMAYGTETIKRVDKIVGPGNIYVATAKRLVFGDVDIDMIAGPSEVLIIADETVDPSFISADLLSQAEHDEMASSILVTDSEPLAKRVCQELVHQLQRLGRRDIAARSIQRYGAIILVGSLDEAVQIANDISPEHLEIMVKNPKRFLSRIRNAGAVFLGEWSPEPLGDYSAGPNHTLPTGGTARFFSPLGVYDFIKRTSLLYFKREGFMKLAKTVETIADIEGLEAHGDSIRARMNKIGDSH
ncbi:MAG: histidinol dehydrogenase [Thermodesulfovibrionia bacterium]